MADVTREEIKKIVRDVVAGMGLKANTGPKANSTASQKKGLRVLIVFHAGVRRLDEALKQSRLIEEAASKCGVFTGESARRWVCGEDVKEKAGARCILDTVKPDGLEKVLEFADVLVLPTFCLKAAAKVASLICDDLESSIVLSALLHGKKVLASRDGFLVCDVLTNEKLREEIERVLNKLEGFGILFCPTDQLAEVYNKKVAAAEKPETEVASVTANEDMEPRVRLITAKMIHAAANNRQSSIRLAPGGKVTPLGRDLAKEYSIRIIED